MYTALAHLFSFSVSLTPLTVVIVYCCWQEVLTSFVSNTRVQEDNVSEVTPLRNLKKNSKGQRGGWSADDNFQALWPGCGLTVSLLCAVHLCHNHGFTTHLTLTSSICPAGDALLTTPGHGSTTYKSLKRQRVNNTFNQRPFLWAGFPTELRMYTFLIKRKIWRQLFQLFQIALPRMTLPLILNCPQCNLRC